ncbi:hypothetical protein Q8A67_004128 [Cirrhinus molitorella]|uniref:Uncharacterized protein n=1 Tax=Cirrhinus molitorella TaxID=172907 RepID=A0AA88QC62_9TELE|nr:hypothetical protein Q8A67_004128 [Cirrhinus molitorella]
MESSKVMSSDKATVIIQVNPQVAQGTAFCDDGQQAGGAYHNTALKEFFKAQPKALGTVQIMIGVVIFFIGIVITINHYSRHYDIFIISGITYWGSLIYITAGSLSVAAQNKLHPCVVKASLSMNVISTITAVIAITQMGIEMVDLSDFYHRCYYRPDSEYCSSFKLIISICISGFACKATCNTDSTVVNVALNQGY